MKVTAIIFALFGLMALPTEANAYWISDLAAGVQRHHRHTVQHSKAALNQERHDVISYAHGTTSLDGYPKELIDKTHEIERDCGSKIVSAYRPGAMVCYGGRCRLSDHATKTAVDIAGNPVCIYARLRGWRGGYSTDYAAVRHVHISYNRHSPEWGARFAHHPGASRQEGRWARGWSQ